MTTYRFTAVTRTATRKGTCPVCGKKGTRQTTIENTVNPFNRNSAGFIRTYQEVSDCVDALAKEWSAKPFVHARCEETQ